MERRLQQIRMWQMYLLHESFKYYNYLLREAMRYPRPPLKVRATFGQRNLVLEDNKDKALAFYDKYRITFQEVYSKNTIDVILEEELNKVMKEAQEEFEGILSQIRLV